MSVLSIFVGALIALQSPPISTPTTAFDSVSATATTTDSAGSVHADEAISRARQRIGDADYDGSIEILKRALAIPNLAVERKREAYLLLIKTYVFLGNDLKFKPQGHEASNLNYQEAKRVIAECLRTRELRHTHPDSLSDPPEMLTFFADLRRQLFGTVRVLDVSPAFAYALFDGDTLRALNGQDPRGETDVAAGTHQLEAGAVGYKSRKESIVIAPGATLEIKILLERRRGPWWYVSRWGGALGVVGGVAAVAASGGHGGSESPLPGAPGPP